MYLYWSMFLNTPFIKWKIKQKTLLCKSEKGNKYYCPTRHPVVLFLVPCKKLHVQCTLMYTVQYRTLVHFLKGYRNCTAIYNWSTCTFEILEVGMRCRGSRYQRRKTASLVPQWSEEEKICWKKSMIFVRNIIDCCCFLFSSIK